MASSAADISEASFWVLELYELGRHGIPGTLGLSGVLALLL